MRVENDGVTTRGGLFGLAFAVCSCGLAAMALGQQPPPRKTTTPVKEQATQEKKPIAGPGSVEAKKPSPTYSEDVASILQAKCQNCHRRHQVGPFALETYEQARKRAHDIAAVTEERSMPPWKPTRGVGPKLKHDQSLTPAEIAI